MNKNDTLKIDVWDALKQEINELSISENKKIDYYHYTSIDGILGIFSDFIDGSEQYVTSCRMRASHIRFLNDAKEYNDGLTWINKEQPNPESSVYENIYNISFCGDGDLLSQWKWYGKNSGISIKFDLANIKYNYFLFENNEITYEDISTRPISVKYKDEEKKDFFNRIKYYEKKHNLNKHTDLITKHIFVPFCKDECFSEEKESRLIFFTADANEHSMKFDIKYITYDGIIKPTLNVTFLAKKNNKNIIKELIVGPGQNQNMVFNALIHIFDSNEFRFTNNEKKHKCENGIIIKKSQIPFRG